MKVHIFPNGLLTALAATTAILSSCHKDIELKLKPFQPQIVLNSFIAADSLIAVHVSRTWTLGEDISTNRLDDAEVSIHVNGVLQVQGQSLARTGDSVRIAVRQAGYAEASAEVVVPRQTPLISVDTIRYTEPFFSNYPMMRCLIRFKDLEPGRKNYYRLIVEHEVTGADGKRELVTDDFQYSQDPALSEGFKDVNDEMFGTIKDNVYGIFTDDLFDGKEYTLNISFSPQFSTTYDVRYTFTLASLSPSAYLYYKSRIFNNDGGGDNYFTEPSAIYTNVTNGLGIVGAYQTSTLSIDMPSYSTQ
jgi:hypothetical protein